jgi:3-deoxy-D-manno-octulosonic-acid transferase
MYLIYSLLLGLGFVIMLPRFLLDAWRHGKYVSGLSERLGNLESNSDGRPVIWLHCVSVGEVQAARPLLKNIRREFPHYSIAISTVTVTGQELAREVFKGQADRIFYLPVDWRWSVRRAITAVRPSLVLIMERELWPNFLYECQLQEVPVAIVNGRLSERSFGRYQLVGSFFRRVVGCLSAALMQTEPDAARMRALGLPSERVMVTGNLKFDAGASEEKFTLTTELAGRFRFLDGRPVLLAASTHDPEERIILETFAGLRAAGLKEIRLIIAPRHPERFDTVASLLGRSQFSMARRSHEAVPGDIAADVVLLDTIGELRALFPLADVVFVGGSIAPIGGHNILEPAAVGACIVTGPHTKNFDEIVNTFSASNALVQIGPANNGEATTALRDVCKDLLLNPERRHQLGQRGKALVEENRGATLRTIDILKTLLSSSGRSHS